MVFEIKGKVALVTGGTTGIGLSIVKELLDNGIKGVVMASTNEIIGQETLSDLSEIYDKSRILFIKTDVTDFKSFDNAFKATIKQFQHIDILFNNAGIVNEVIWERSIDINLKGVINGMLLGMEKYLIKYKQEGEAAIINISSIVGLEEYPVAPIYSSTKSGIIALTRSYGNLYHFNRTKIKTFVICPGYTETPLIDNFLADNLKYIRPESLEILEQLIGGFIGQSPEYLAKEALKVLKNATSGSIWVVEEGKPAYEFIIPDRTMFVNNVLKNKY